MSVPFCFYRNLLNSLFFVSDTAYKDIAEEKNCCECKLYSGIYHEI